MDISFLDFHKTPLQKGFWQKKCCDFKAAITISSKINHPHPM